MVSCSAVFGGISVALSLLFYVIAIGVEWGTFNNFGGSTTGSILVSIPIGVVCTSFCFIMICAGLCSHCDEDLAIYFAAGCSTLICCCGGVIAFVGGGFLIAAGIHNRMERISSTVQ